jgi:hypothetical protein
MRAEAQTLAAGVPTKFFVALPRAILPNIALPWIEFLNPLFNDGEVRGAYFRLNPEIDTANVNMVFRGQQLQEIITPGTPRRHAVDTLPAFFFSAKTFYTEAAISARILLDTVNQAA